MSKELLEQLGFKDANGVYLPMLSEFVKNQTNELYDENGFLSDRLKNIINYTNFITQPLTKGMFIPCDEEGNVYKNNPFYSTDSDKQAYQQAEERVLFEGAISGVDKFSAEYFYNGYSHLYETIEQAINNGVKMYLK